MASERFKDRGRGIDDNFVGGLTSWSGLES